MADTTDTERETPGDDFKVEITDLDQPADPLHPRRPRLTPRQRNISVGLTVALFVLIVGLLMSSSSEMRGLLGQTFVRPSPTASNDLAVYLRGNPSWGHFTLDGKALAHVPAIGRDHPLTLTPGQHTIIWQAEPFKSETCHFIVVSFLTVSGPCFLNSEVSASFIPHVSGMVISFFASLSDLSADQRAPLVQQIQKELTLLEGNETVYPGEVYAVSTRQVGTQTTSALCKVVQRSHLCYAHADQPLKATLTLHLDTSTSRDDPCAVAGECESNQQDCRVFCEDPFMIYSGQQMDGWNIQLVVRLLWSYRTLSGQLIASNQPNTALGGQNYQFASAHLDRPIQGGWHITMFSDNGPGYIDPPCQQASVDATQLMGDNFTNSQSFYVRQTHDNPQRTAAGCLAIAQSPNEQVGTTPTPTQAARDSSPAYFLLRFGVILAANDTAHRILPDIPIADTYEKSLVQNLLAHLPPLA